MSDRRPWESLTENQKVMRLRCLILKAWDEGWLAGNAGRNWDAMPAWHAGQVKKDLEELFGSTAVEDSK